MFKNDEVVVEVTKYNEPSNTAIVIKDKVDGQVRLVATVNLDEEIPKNLVVIKDYSENKGILEWLIMEGIVTPTFKKIPLGYDFGHICMIDEKTIEKYSV